MGFPAIYSQIPCEKQYYAYIHHKVIYQDFSQLITFEFCGHSVDQVSSLDEKWSHPGSEANSLPILPIWLCEVRAEILLFRLYFPCSYYPWQSICNRIW